MCTHDLPILYTSESTKNVCLVLGKMFYERMTTLWPPGNKEQRFLNMSGVWTYILHLIGIYYRYTIVYYIVVGKYQLYYSGE